jgi:hypothetical protein
MLRRSWAVVSMLASGCYGAASLPTDAGADVAFDAPAACMPVARGCADGVDEAATRVPTFATFDGVRVDYARVEMVSSLAFSVFHQVTLLPDLPDCSTPVVRVQASPPDGSSDAHTLGPRDALVSVGIPGHGLLHTTSGQMDVIAYDDEAHVWHGHLVVNDARLQLDVEVTVPRCGDVSGP